MAKRKSRKNTKFSINKKYANARLKKIDELMDELKAAVGKKGDGVNKSSATLIGAMEGLNNVVFGGQIQKYYTEFNNSVLPKFKTKITRMDWEFEIIDRLTG